MIRPEDLRAVRKQGRLEWSPAGMARGERQVSGDVPILGQGDVSETLCKGIG